MKLDPLTTGDFHRIYNHHEDHSADGRADEIEKQLYEDAEICDSYPTARYRGLTFKRVENGYRFFFTDSFGINVIYAIYHEKENWQNLIEGRHDTFNDV